MAKFSSRLAAYRAAHRLNQEEMGEKLGVTGKYVGMLERGDKEVEESSTISQLLAMYERQGGQGGPAGPHDPCGSMREARLRKGLTIAQLAKITKYRPDVLQAIEDGRGQASEKMIDAICAALGLDKADLIDGNDENTVRDRVVGTFGAKPDFHAGPGVGTPRYIPLISFAQAGTMKSFDDFYEREGSIYFDVRDPKAFSVRIVGDSMAPNYAQGDIAILYPTAAPKNGDTVIARLNDEHGSDVMFKLYSTRDSGQHVVLTSYNQAYPPLDFKRSDFDWIYPVVAVTKMLRK